MENLQRITMNKENIAKERVEKAKTRETTKRKRGQEKEMERAIKEKRVQKKDMARNFFFEKDLNIEFRATDAKSERRNKEIWTQEMVEEYRENLQKLMKNRDKEVLSYIDTTL